MAGVAKSNVAMVVVLAVMAALMAVQQVEAANYTVGDSLGWNIPANSVTTYSDWASKNSFEAGDNLVFNFTTGVHDVAIVTKEDFDGCVIDTPLDYLNITPAVYSLDVGGDYYFICTQGGGSHCKQGMQLAISVASAPSPSSPPLPRRNPTTPKDTGGSVSLAVTSPLIFISMAMSFMILVL